MNIRRSGPRGLSSGPTPVLPPMPAGLGLASDRARERMVDALRAAGIRDEHVLAAMNRVPRHLFIDAGLASRGYEDVALPIGHGQTISKPSTVARMIEALVAPIAPDRRRQARVLEVGTGCGYQAAVLAAVFGEVVSIERVRGLHEAARANLRSMRLPNLRLVFGDGRLGAPTAAPFDAIVVAAAGDAIPDELLTQMGVPSRLLAPIEERGRQALHLVERSGRETWQLTVLDAVRFVPLRAGTT
ncbi:MAG TPA: protein-L-isoaspartate(D-aspartate) O-methyltransferase [Quisquiliibacterium sp.]|nr:protein-L-isoaspartate(D-aspartate) O-methyltransferase [Quisquiliibacterium sp.]